VTYTGVTELDNIKTVTGLTCGYYYLTVTDANGCYIRRNETELPCATLTAGSFDVWYGADGQGGIGTACAYAGSGSPSNKFTLYMSSMDLDTYGLGLHNLVTYYDVDGRVFNGHLYGTVADNFSFHYGTITSLGVFISDGYCY
jgi:hypothetical protein